MSLSASFKHHSLVMVELRDGITGELIAYREAHNYKLTGTYRLLVSALTTSTPYGVNTGIIFCGVGNGTNVVSSDSSLTTEFSTSQGGGRTLGRKSMNVGAAVFYLSFSFSNGSIAKTIRQVGLFYTPTRGAGVAFLKATIASVSMNAADQLNVVWIQSFGSA